MSSLCYLQAIYLSIFVSYTENNCSQQDVKQIDIILVSRKMEYYFLLHVDKDTWEGSITRI